MLITTCRSRPSNNGFVTIFTLIVGAAILSLISLVWDGGGEIDGFRNANEAAREAARTAAQCVDVNAYLTTGQAVVQDPSHDGAKAFRCAHPYEQITNSTLPAGYSVKIDSVVLGNLGNTVTARVTVTKPVLFFSIFGFTGSTTGQATVKLATGVIDSGG